MAKKAPKETSLALVISLVFFVLTTIAFGVMWYMQYSDQQAKDEAVKKITTEKTTEAGLRADAELKARVYRKYIGIDEPDDVTALGAETKGKNVIAAELKKINEAAAKAAGFSDGLNIWPLDDKGMASDPPAKGILPVIGESLAKRKDAEDRAKSTMTDYAAAIANITKAVDEFKKSTKDFQTMAVDEPKKFEKKLNDEIKKYEERKAKFSDVEKETREMLTKVDTEKEAAVRAKTKLENQVNDLQQQVAETASKLMEKKDPFQYDLPQGKIIRRLPDNILEINIGSNALVKPGLTFTVLPSDFPEKGRQSRMHVIRVPNERGEYKSVPQFVEKATVEVIEVLGPNLSRARITKEADYIRDGAGPGDLLYNSAWRKGTADHVALAGIFDINGDGTDDIETVVRDLLRMGIPVDAYLDLKQRKWVGQINEQTRYLIVGRYPVQSVTDPNRDDKTAIYGAMSKSVAEARQKGVQDVNYRDFFPRMGYRVKIDVSDDRINQATSPYLKGVNTTEAPPPGGN